MFIYKNGYFLSVTNIREKKGNEPKHQMVNVGKDARLSCHVDKDWKGTVYWQKNNKTIHAGENPARMRVKLNSYLKIKKARKEDKGDYTCVAENDCGRNTYTITLYVDGK